MAEPPRGMGHGMAELAKVTLAPRFAFLGNASNTEDVHTDR